MFDRILGNIKSLEGKQDLLTVEDIFEALNVFFLDAGEALEGNKPIIKNETLFLKELYSFWANYVLNFRSEINRFLDEENKTDISTVISNLESTKDELIVKKLKNEVNALIEKEEEKLKKTNEELQSLNLKKNKLESDVTQNNENIEKAKNDIENAEKDVEEAQKDVQRAKEHIKTLEGDKVRIKEDEEKYKKEIVKLKDNIKQLDAESGKTKESIIKLRRDVVAHMDEKWKEDALLNFINTLDSKSLDV